MPVVLTITSDLAEVGARFERAAAAAPEIIMASLEEAAHGVGEIVVPIMADATPHRSGALADSTVADVDAGGGEARVDIRQPALSLPNQDGSGGGEPYVQWVVMGRGPVEPVNKKALAGPGFGPVRHAGPADPNPYPTQAIGDAWGEVEAFLLEREMITAARIVEII